MERIEATSDHPLFDVHRHAPVRIARFRVRAALDTLYPGLRVRIQIVGCDMSDDVVPVMDFQVIVGESISVEITRRVDRHDNSGGSGPRLPRECGPENVTEAGKLGCSLPFAFVTCSAVNLIHDNLVWLWDLNLDLDRWGGP
jgi:hypothetical protein